MLSLKRLCKIDFTRLSLVLSITLLLFSQAWLPAHAMRHAELRVAAPAPQELAVVVNINGADLFQQPNGTLSASLPSGTMLTATGRSQDGTWIYVEQDDGQSGWLAAAQVIAFGLERLPLLPIESAPDVPPGATEPAANTELVQASAPVTASNIITKSATEDVSPAVAMRTEDESATSAPQEATLDEANVEEANVEEPPAAAVDSAMQPAMQAEVELASGRLNIRSGPDTSYAILGKSYAQDTLDVLARDATSQWVQIALPAQDGEIGWVSAAYLHFTAAIDALPVSEMISTAAPLATSAADALPQPGSQPRAAQNNSQAPIATSNQVANTATAPAAGLSGTLVFQSGPGGMIYAYDLDDGRVWSLTNGFDPAISPDGRQVAFTRDGGQSGIYLIDIGGGSERLIFSGRSSLASPKWSPDGQWILFSRGDEYWECRTFGFGTCVSGDFGGGRPGAQPPGFSVDDLPIMRTQEFNLAVVDTNGENYHDIAALETARTPDWNEAGIVYQSSAGIQRTDDKPDAENQLVSFNYLNPYYHDPDWQPGGGRILFQMRGASHWEIYSMNADGANMVNLTKPVTTLVEALPSNVAAAWSPDGQHIVYASNRGEDNSAGAWRLWVMDGDGGNQHPLPLDVAIDYTFGGDQIVSWGP